MTGAAGRDDPLDPRELDALWNFDDPAGSEARLRERLATFAPGSVAAAELQTQIGRALGLQGRYPEGHDALDAIRNEHPQVLTRVSLERGRLYNSAGESAAAIPFFHKALAHADAAGNEALAIDALHMLAIADSERAEDWTRQGLARAEAATDPRVRRWRGPLHNNLGWALHDRGEYDSALPEFEAALAAYEESGTPVQVHIAHWAIARCLRSLGQYGEALAIQERLARDDPPDPFVDEEIAVLREAIADQGDGVEGPTTPRQP
jgi:tetratricopeptide (TPR) repeat protein